jgi:hypothetical protein
VLIGHLADLGIILLLTADPRHTGA